MTIEHVLWVGGFSLLIGFGFGLLMLMLGLLFSRDRKALLAGQPTAPVAFTAPASVPVPPTKAAE